jgi:NADPH-dependent 2,4-dienoyl-CoA reductase/sulfur reductase-like enzyme/nitrite reductase/ring-hydroxylating ferredoxin subunit
MDYKEFPLGNASDLRDGEMKEVMAGQTKILLARVGEDFHAVSPTCPHYGAPLVEGTLCGTRLLCPWHHACFNVTNGDLVEPPALDALMRYDVRVRDGLLYTSLPAEPPDRRMPSLAKHDPGADNRRFVIIGGGAAGYAAAQTLREDGFQGRIVMITREDRVPYDRPNLSKDYLQGHAELAWLPIRPGEFYDECNIELVCNKVVTLVDARTKTITFDGGESQTYDALLVATGSESRKLNIPGADLKNIRFLRSFADADSIIEVASRSTRAVIIGASFIGMEVAHSLAERGLEVTVVAPSGEPFESTLGAAIGALFRRLHESHNVRFKLGSIVYRFEGDTRVQAVILESGERIETDMVVVGVGAQPATSFLSGVKLHDDGGVMVDLYLRAAEDLYAAGDIARYPDRRTGESVRIEHWRTAQQQGRVAAHNMMGRNIPFDGVPFFWTRQFDAGLLYVGHAPAWDEIIYQGEVSSCDFLAFYLKDERVLAVAGMNRDRDMAAVEELFRLDRMPVPARLREQATDFVALLGHAALNEGRVNGAAERAA